jgi:hypothetical protein
MGARLFLHNYGPVSSPSEEITGGGLPVAELVAQAPTEALAIFREDFPD